MYIRLRRISNLVRLDEGEERKREREGERGERKGGKVVVNPSPLYQGYIQ